MIENNLRRAHKKGLALGRPKFLSAATWRVELHSKRAAFLWTELPLRAAIRPYATSREGKISSIIMASVQIDASDSNVVEVSH